jgi:hypothetical protein
VRSEVTSVTEPSAAASRIVRPGLVDSFNTSGVIVSMSPKLDVLWSFEFGPDEVKKRDVMISDIDVHSTDFDLGRIALVLMFA